MNRHLDVVNYSDFDFNGLYCIAIAKKGVRVVAGVGPEDFSSKTPGFFEGEGRFDIILSKKMEN